MKRIVAVLFPFMLCAADPTGFVQWSAKDLKSYEQKLKPKINAQKVAIEQLGTWGNHNAMIGHREGDGEAELHETVADFFVVAERGSDARRRRQRRRSQDDSAA